RPEDAEQSNLWPIRVIAFDPADPVLEIPGIEAYRRQLQLPDTALMDVKSKKHFGRCAADTQRELAQRNIRVVGTFALGTDFSIDGNILMSDRNFAKFFPDPTSPSVLSKVDVGLIKTDPDVDPITVQRALQQALPDDVV